MNFAVRSELDPSSGACSSIATKSAAVFSADSREGARTHLFIVAALHSGADVTPVHVRNMSPTGALVEAPELPEAGAKITLKRGSLSVTGSTAWKAGHRAGISFDSTIFVSDWMTRKPGDQQHKVDELVANIRHGLVAPPEEAPSQLFASVEAELALLRDELARLGNALAGDLIVVATHPEIQSIDISLQRIDRILAQLATQSTG